MTRCSAALSVVYSARGSRRTRRPASSKNVKRGGGRQRQMRAAKADRGSVASGARTFRPGPPGGQVTASRQTASHYDGCRCAFRACLVCAAGYGRVWKVVKRPGGRGAPESPQSCGFSEKNFPQHVNRLRPELNIHHFTLGVYLSVSTHDTLEK